jgi:SAM-dependent methyltransferase
MTDKTPEKNWSLTRHDLGFLRVTPSPSVDELRAHYESKYFNAGQYADDYTDEELVQKTADAEEIRFVATSHATATEKSILDLGCGEGYVLSHFRKHGWEVTGADFTDDGIKRRNPDVADAVTIGDLFATIDQLSASGKRWSVVTCNNVLEHVIDPLGFLDKARGLVAEGGILHIVVPNDDCRLQADAIERGYVKPNFFVLYPDHLSYFNVDTLGAVLRDRGLEVLDVLAKFPVDFFLYHPDSLYVGDRVKGKAAHYARVRLDNLMFADGIEKLVGFRRGCAAGGVGRNLSAYACLKVAGGGDN